MKKSTFAALAARVLVCTLVFLTLCLTSCNDEPDVLKNKVESEFNGTEKPTPEDPTLSDVMSDECKFVKSNDTEASSENGVATVSRSYDYEKTFVLVYSDDTEKEQVEEYKVEHSIKLSGLTAPFIVDNIDEIAGKTFEVTDNKVEIADHEVSVEKSKKGNRSVEFSNGYFRWNFAVDQSYSEEKLENGVLYRKDLCSNNITDQYFTFSNAEKVEGTDNTYNLVGTFTAEVSEGDAIVYTFSAVATTSEKDEVYYSIENVRQEGNVIVFEGVEGHTLHPERNTRETLRQEFDASLRAGETIRYNDLNNVSEANQNGNVFRYTQGSVTLVATYPSEVVIEFHGVQQTVSIPAPAFAEVNRNAATSEDDDYNYLTTTITYSMSWNEVVVASAEQTFIGRTEKEKDAVTRIYLDYTENNGVINGKLIEEHTLADDVVLLQFSGNREFSVKAENTITIEAENSNLTRTDHKAGSWSKTASYAGNNIKGDKMSATFVYTYNGKVNNNVVVSMNRNLYVEYAGKKYEIANPEATLTGSNPANNGQSADSTYDLYNYTVTYTATAADMQATAAQKFVVKVKKPEHTIAGWEVDEAYANRFAVTYSWNAAANSYKTYNGIVFRNINDHSQKKMVVFAEGSTTPLREQNLSASEMDAFWAKRGATSYVSVNYSDEANSEIAALIGDFSKHDDSYKNSFGYVTVSGNVRAFDPLVISHRNLPEPFRGMITKDSKGLWGGLYF